MPSKGSIKRKLFATVAMTLVAVILLSGVSYAWLVLSTRPEASKITTAIGANGSLEIALATPAHLQRLIANDMYEEDTALTFAGEDLLLRNTQWGNLLDLSDEGYGLTNLLLRPTMLNTLDNTIQDNPILTAAYGTDGRIRRLSSYSSTGAWDAVSSSFLIEDGTAYGVRVAGVTANAKLMERIEAVGEIINLAVEETVGAQGDLLTDALYHMNESSDAYTTANLRVLVDQLRGIPADEEQETEAVPGLLDTLLELEDTVIKAFEGQQLMEDGLAMAQISYQVADISQKLDEADAQLAALEESGAAVLTLDQVLPVLEPIMGESSFQYLNVISSQEAKWEADTQRDKLNQGYDVQGYFGEGGVVRQVGELCGFFMLETGGITWFDGVETPLTSQLKGESMAGVYAESFAQLKLMYSQMESYEKQVAAWGDEMHRMAMEYFFDIGMSAPQELNYSDAELQAASASVWYGSLDYLADSAYGDTYISALEQQLKTFKEYLNFIETYHKTAVLTYVSSGAAPAESFQQVMALESSAPLRDHLTAAGLTETVYVRLADKMESVEAYYNAVRSACEQYKDSQYVTNPGEDDEITAYQDHRLYEFWNTFLDLEAMTMGGSTYRELKNQLNISSKDYLDVYFDTIDWLYLGNEEDMYSLLAMFGDWEDYTQPLTQKQEIGALDVGTDGPITVRYPGVGHSHGGSTYYHHGYLYQAFESIRDGRNPENAIADWETLLADTEAGINTFRGIKPQELADTEFLVAIMLRLYWEGKYDVTAYNDDIHAFAAVIDELVEQCGAHMRQLVLLYAAGHNTVISPEGQEPVLYRYDEVKKAYENGAELNELVTLAEITDTAFLSAYDKYRQMAGYAQLQDGVVFADFLDLQNYFYQYVTVRPQTKTQLILSSVPVEMGQTLASAVHDLFIDLEYYQYSGADGDDYEPVSNHSSMPVIASDDAQVIFGFVDEDLPAWLYYSGYQLDMTQKSSLSLQPQTWSDNQDITRLYELAVNNGQLEMSDRDFVYRNASQFMSNYANVCRNGYQLYLKNEQTIARLAVDGVRRVWAPQFGEAAGQYQSVHLEALVEALQGLNMALNAYPSYVNYALLVEAASPNTDAAVYDLAVAAETCQERFEILDIQEDAAIRESYSLALELQQTIAPLLDSAQGLLTGSSSADAEKVDDIIGVLFALSSAKVNGMTPSAFLGQLDSDEAVSSLQTDGVTFHVPASVMAEVQSLFETGTSGSRILYGEETISISLSADHSTYQEEIPYRAEMQYSTDRYLTNSYSQVLSSATYPNESVPTGPNEESYYLIADTYCFAVDLLFRTNAPEANLLLQSEAESRVNSGQNAQLDETMGSGSFLRADDAVIQNAMTVVFADTLTNEVYATAYVGEGGTLYLNGDSTVITALEQNKVKTITVWIFLDGNKVTNLDVGADVITQLDINLQFATDTDLIAADLAVSAED